MVEFCIILPIIGEDKNCGIPNLLLEYITIYCINGFPGKSAKNVLLYIRNPEKPSRLR